MARNLAGANRLIGGLLGGEDLLRVEIVENARAAAAAPVWRVTADGISRFRFHAAIYETHAAMIFGRWIACLPMIAAAGEAAPPGWCAVNLGDDGHRPGLAFCDNRPGYVLVPDCVFLMTAGYAELAAGFAARAIPWGARAPVLFWRGATTGRRGQSLEALPRLRLCRLAATLGARADVGFSGFTETSADEEAMLRAEGLVRPYVPIDELDRYRLHLDIDGHTNSWPGLLAKLHSGSPVLKVASPAGYRQWYYDRLVPWENYVPVRADLADLGEAVERLCAAPGLAQAIGAAGQALARGMTAEREIAWARPVIARAFRD